MTNQTLEKIDSVIEVICEAGCKRINTINTDRLIALAEMIGKLLSARAELRNDQSKME